MIGRVFRHGAIYTAGALLSRGIGFFLLPLYTYTLSGADYAAVDYLTVIGAFVAVTLALEVTQAVARYLPEMHSDREGVARLASTGFWFTLCVHLLLLGAVLIWEEALGRLFFDQAVVPGLLPWAAAAWMSVGLVTWFRNLLRADLRPRASTAVAIMHAALVLALTGALLLTGEATAADAMIALTTGGAAAALFGLWLSRATFRFSFSAPAWRQLAAFSSPLVFASVGVIAAQFIDRIMIVELLGLEALGPYAVAGRIALMVSLLLVGFQNAMTPLIYAGLQDPATQGHVARLFRWFLGASLIGLAAMAVADEWIVWLIAPATYAAAADLTPLLVASVILMAGQSFFPGLAIKAKTVRLALISLTAAGMNLLLNLILIPRMGIEGAALATLLSALIAVGGVAFASQRLWPVPLDRRPLFLGVLTALSAIWLGWHHAANSLEALIYGGLALGFSLFMVTGFGLIRFSELAQLRHKLLRRPGGPA